jgi:hypothetical protein
LFPSLFALESGDACMCEKPLWKINSEKMPLQKKYQKHQSTYEAWFKLSSTSHFGVADNMLTVNK